MYVVSGFDQWVAVEDTVGMTKAGAWFVVAETREIDGRSVPGYRKVVLHKGFRSECTEYDATAIVCQLGASGVTHYNGDTVIFHTEKIGGVVVRDAGGQYVGTRDLGRKSFQGWDNATPKDDMLADGVQKAWVKVWGPVYGYQGNRKDLAWQAHEGMAYTDPTTVFADTQPTVEEPVVDESLEGIDNDEYTEPTE